MPSLAELLDTSAQWGRGVQNKISDLVSPEAWAQALRNPPRVLSQYQQMQPGQQQQTISEAFDNALNFGPAMLGKIVYHGSPHKFDAFDASKIGTGEGAQAYGHGLYFAEAPEVAKEYQKKIVYSKGAEGQAAYYLQLYKTPEKALEVARANVKPYMTPEAQEYGKEVIKRLEDGNINQGSLYKVDLPDEHIAKMLDWDKPLSQQSKEVQAALKGIANKFPEIPNFNLQKWMDADPLASTWHNVLQRDLGVSPDAITATLKDRGIPGIRYLDQGSRAGGQGTSNYVVFPGNEKLTKILERN